MKPYTKLPLVLLILLIVSCLNNNSSTVKEAVEIKVIDLLNTSLKVNLSEYFDSSEYIKLETTDSSMIGQIDKIAVSDKHILIYDDNVGRILLFSRDGKFLKRWMNRGKGPNEFITVNNIEFTPSGNVFLLINSGLIYEFSIDGGLIRVCL